jgi:hypothetical protein
MHYYSRNTIATLIFLVVDKRHHATIHAATQISVETREMEIFISVETWVVPQPQMGAPLQILILKFKLIKHGKC